MTKKELKKYTVDFMNNETGSNRSNLNSVMGNMLIRYAEIFQKQIAELEEKLANADYQLEGRDLEISELKAQIEKMKNCNNCKHFYFNTMDCVHETPCVTKFHENWELY